MFVSVSKLPKLAARLPSGAQSADSQAMFPPVHRKQAVAMRYVAKYWTAGGTGASKIVYPAIPMGAQMTSGKKRAVYLSESTAPMA